MLATDACPNVTSEIFQQGSEPTEYCTTHPGRPLSSPGADSSDAEPRTPQSLRQLDQADRQRKDDHIRN
jgi:hypothetical protein